MAQDDVIEDLINAYGKRFEGKTPEEIEEIQRQDLLNGIKRANAFRAIFGKCNPAKEISGN
jgi:hypothetical protein